jgi:DNA-binding response OmpR family regulator
MDVVLLRWPAEGSRRALLATRGVPRLLLLDADMSPPPVQDCLEDWIRVPAADRDVAARVAALSGRAYHHDPPAPALDPYGVLRLGTAWVSLPPVEARLAGALLDGVGAVVGRDALSRAGWPAGSPGRNALDVHVLRLRRRIAPLGLAIRTVRSRGYLLEVATALPAAAGDPA